MHTKKKLRMQKIFCGKVCFGTKLVCSLKKTKKIEGDFKITFETQFYHQTVLFGYNSRRN